jgi:hypothetical protein
MDRAPAAAQVGARRDDFDNANDWLNMLVERKIAESRASGETMAPEIAWVAETGHRIYQRRFKALVVAVVLASAYGILQAPSLPALLVAALALYLYIDFYSGMLHVVLDNPESVTLPIVGIPCVEFQWHHTLSYDISSRSLLDVWGDLNVLVCLKLAGLFGLMGFTPTSMMVAGVGFFWGYTNQWSHRMTHSAVSKRPRFAIWLQEHGVILAPAVHHIHHSGAHDEAFPVLSGHTRGLIQWLLRVTSNRWVWLVGFAVLTFVDLASLVWVLQRLPV